MKNSPLALRAIAAACALSCVSISSLAQTTPELKPVIVTATRTATKADELVSDVVVIDQAQLAQQSGRTLAEVLTRLGGLQFSSNGGLGKSSNVFIRGTETRHTILLIDGVRYGSATLGTPVWDNLPLDAIERIEILKGPASSLYGSDAIGGVVQIFTREGSKGITPRVGITLGSNSYRKLNAGVGGSAGDLSFNVDVSHLSDKGFSATNPLVPFGNFNSDRDGFKQDSANLSLKYRFNKDWNVDAGVLYADGLNRFDSGPKRDTRAEVRSEVYRLALNGKVLPIWSTSLRYGDSQDRSNNLEPASLFQTQQTQWTWQNDIDTAIGVVTAGAEQLKQNVSGTTKYAVKSRSVSSLFVGLSGSTGIHSWQANVRNDKNSQFGKSNTGFVGYGVEIAKGLRANASYGTSFTAPSFNQLYFPGFGTPTLQPERGRNTEIGLTYSASGHTVKLIHFDNKIRGFIASGANPANIPRARIDGWTLGYEGRLVETQDRLVITIR